MLLKLLLKLLPALIPVFSYIFWVVIVEGIIVRYILNKIYNKNKKNSDVIDGDYEIVGDKSTKSSDKFANYQSRPLKERFSLQDKIFVSVIYLSLVIAILSLIYFALK